MYSSITCIYIIANKLKISRERAPPYSESGYLQEKGKEKTRRRKIYFPNNLDFFKNYI